MNPDDLAKILDELGTRLGPAGQHVFELAVRQVYVNGVFVVVLGIVLGLATAVGWPRVYRWITAGKQGGYYSNDRELAGVVIAVIYGGLWAAWIFAAVYTIPALFNPEYAAIRDILERIKP